MKSYLSSHIRCPAPSYPYKCVCLGILGSDIKTRTRGKITGDTCECEIDTNVTRAVCCQADNQDNHIVFKV